MTTATVTAQSPASSFVVSDAVRIESNADAPANVPITFQGMSGCEIQRGTRMFESIQVTGWLLGATLAAVQDSFDAIAATLASLSGADGDKIAFAFTPSGSKTIENIDQVGAVSIVESFQFPASHGRKISFSVRRCR